LAKENNLFMSEVLRISKRILTVSVVVTTIAWSIGFAAFVMPLAAEAATLASGDLIKASTPAVYYYAADGKRYVFPNENTYFSWYPDFSGVKEITDEELAVISIGGNITIRPGTFLVKITTDPKVYAVTSGGVLHWVESEDVAQKLWLSDWADWVVDVPDSFFTNYSIGSSINDYTHPDGCIIKYEGDATVYFVESATKRAVVDEAAFNANMFQWRFLINPIAADVVYTNGSDITGKEAGLVDLVAGAAGSGTGLEVKLASDTPAGATIAAGSAGVELVKVAATASSDGNVILDSLTFHRIGVGTAANFSNVYLYEGTNRLTSGRSINTTSNEAQFNNLNLDIDAGETRYFTVKGDVATGAAVGNEHALELVDADAVGTSATVSGSFPITGNTFTIGAQNAATLTVTKGTTPSNPTVGEQNASISAFRLAAAGSDVNLYQVNLLQAGTITNSDLTDLTLWVGSTQVASAAVLNDDHINFVLDSPYTIADGTTKTLYVKATIAGKANRTIVTYFEYTTDVAAIDSTYGFGANVIIALFDSGTVPNTENVTVITQGGQVTIADLGLPTGNIPKAGNDQMLFEFAMTAAETAVEVRRVAFGIIGVNTDDYLDASGTDLFTDVKIVDTSTGTTLAGPTQLSSGTTTEGGATACGNDVIACYWVLTDSFNIDAGATRNLAIKVDVANNTWFDSDRQYYAQLNNWGSDAIKEVDTGDYVAVAKIVPNTDINGNTQTVKASSLTVQLASTPVSDTWVKKAVNVPSAGFVFTAGSQGDITVSSVKISGSANIDAGGYDVADLNDAVTTLSLWDGSTQVGIAQSVDGTLGTATFSGFNWVVPAGTSKTLTVKASLDSVASTGTPDVYWVGINVAADITAEDSDNNSVTPTDGLAGWDDPANTGTVAQTIMDSGVLTVTPESNPDSDILVAGKDSWYTFVQAKATAQYEDIAISAIRVQRYSGGTNGTIKNLAIQKDGVIVSSGTDQLPGSATATDIVLTTPIVVPADGSVTFQVVGKLNAIGTGAASGHNPVLAIEYNTQNGEWDTNYANQYNIAATGDQSGETILAASGSSMAGNVMVVRRTKLSIAKQILNVGLSNGSMDLYKFQATADSAGDASFAKVGFTLTKSGTFGISDFRWFRDSTDITSSVDIVDANGVDLKTGTYATGTVSVRYTSGTEQSISGSGHMFTLRATMSSIGTAGQSLNTEITQDAGTTVYTLGLAGTSGLYPYPNLTAQTANFVWSDKSAVPHSAAIGAPSSLDWTNSYLVDDLTESQILNYN
jgi:hypothetical protein